MTGNSTAYRGYLIRWTYFTPDHRVWVEKDAQLICWAETVEQAQAAIDALLR